MQVEIPCFHRVLRGRLSITILACPNRSASTPEAHDHFVQSRDHPARLPSSPQLCVRSGTCPRSEPRTRVACNCWSIRRSFEFCDESDESSAVSLRIQPLKRFGSMDPNVGHPITPRCQGISAGIMDRCPHPGSQSGSLQMHRLRRAKWVPCIFHVDRLTECIQIQILDEIRGI